MALSLLGRGMLKNISQVILRFLGMAVTVPPLQPIRQSAKTSPSARPLPVQFLAMKKLSRYFALLLFVASCQVEAQEDNFVHDFLKRELFAKASIGQTYVNSTNDANLSLACVSGMAKWRISDQAEQRRFIRNLAALKQPVQHDIEHLMEMLDSKKLAEEEKTSLADLCIASMVGSLDKRSQYYSRKDIALNKLYNRDDWGQLQFQIQYEQDVATIIYIPTNSSAYSSGLRVGDHIEMIDDEKPIANDVTNYQRLTRGPLGSKVKLTVSRDGVLLPMSIEVAREKSIPIPIKSERLENDILYISAIKTDQAALAKIAAALKNQNDLAHPLRGVILDLRNNTGDMLPAVVGVAAAFLKQESLVCEVRMSEGKTPYRLYANPDFYREGIVIDPFKDLPAWSKTVPIAVLTNAVTASGAELIAAALQDNKRAIVVGQLTARKAVVQTVISDPYGARLRITSGVMYRPSLQSLDGVGVTPDIEVSYSASNDGNTPPGQDAVVTTAIHALLSPQQ